MDTDTRGRALMYRWLWDRIPGGTAVRAAVASALAVVVVIVFAVVVVPALRPVVPGSVVDGSGADQDGVIEPDGVRKSPTPAPTTLEPTPSVPDDGGPQQ